MKVRAALAFVQIAGILGIVIAQEPSGNLNSRLLHSFQAILRNMSTTEYESAFFVVNELARLKCETIGGPKAYDTSNEGLHIYVNSFTAQKNATELQLEAIANKANSGLNSAIEPICQFVTNTNDISKSLTDSLRICWTQPERNSIDLISNVTVAVSQFMCENGSNHISAFLKNDALSCLYSTIQNSGIERCALANFVGNVSPIENNHRDIIPPWSVPVIVPKTENCMEFVNFRQCVVSMVQGCAPSTLLTEINSLFNILFESTGCNSLLRAYNTSLATNTN